MKQQANTELKVQRKKPVLMGMMKYEWLFSRSEHQHLGKPEKLDLNFWTRQVDKHLVRARMWRVKRYFQEEPVDTLRWYYIL